MTTAERNRAIKKLLQREYPDYKVTVRGSRGTAYGWVSVHIGYAPRNHRETQELRSQVQAKIAAAGIEIGTYGYDDPGSDYGYGKTISVNFDPCREKADSYGDQAWRQRLSAEDWDQLDQLQKDAHVHDFRPTDNDLIDRCSCGEERA